MSTHLKRIDRTSVACAGARHEIVDREAALAQAPARLGIREFVPEVAGERGDIRRVRLEAPERPAKTHGTIGIHRNMTELAGRMALAAHDLPIDHDAGAHAFRHRSVDEIVGVLAVPRAEPEVREGAGFGCVLDCHAQR